ncbi:DUF4129 domain-containing protein [Bacillus haikouensis]|uniref:DUF4129 domain-containing protein n=1 Tax=Bacillus haikouensis TaxID=1510468 RepID=UPI0015582172|nr:DUF4129 domain-containing protein [Bacillus haikouensis]NQD65913.1 DUF4129 domain-containing protein [Bacillus haikouensis]
MHKKILFGLVFLILISAVGMAIGRTSMLAADKIKSFYKEDDGEKLGDLTDVKVIDYIPRWREMDEDEEAPDDGRRQEVIVLKWGKEIFRDHMGLVEFLKKSAKTPFPYILLLLSFLLFMFYKNRKKKNTRQIDSFLLSREGRAGESANSYSDEEQTLSLEELHQIREVVRKWESGLPFYQKKRPHETIHEWFRRIEGPHEIISIYEKVRYGGKSSSEEELLLLKRVLFKRI